MSDTNSDANSDTSSAVDSDVDAAFVDASSEQPGSRLVTLGWDDRVASGFTEIPAGTVPGRVVRVERGRRLVALADGDHLARSTTAAAVGDWVGVRSREDDVVVEAVVPRWSQLARRDPQGRVQVLASNLDVVFIVAPADRLSAARVEREIAMAWDSGAQPVVLLTKDDVAEPGLAQRLRARLPGVDVPRPAP